jgi:outer membrane lipoprotein SlyB
MKLLFFFLVVLSSCASKPTRPTLYPNQAYKDRGDKVKADVDECLKSSDDYLKTPEGKNLADNYSAPSVSTSVGLGFGGMGTGLGLGFGVGDRGGYRLTGEEQIRRNFTNQCLVNKGYQVVGWSE